MGAKSGGATGRWCHTLSIWPNEAFENPHRFLQTGSEPLHVKKNQTNTSSLVQSDPKPPVTQAAQPQFRGQLHIMCLLAGTGQSPIYNEPFSSMESGACALALGLLQPQTGRPVTKHCTAHGLTTTTAPGHWRTRSSASVTEHNTRTRPEISKRVSMNACGTECVCVYVRV